MRLTSYQTPRLGVVLAGPREKCGVFGIYGKGLEAARLTFYGLWALQHRGQESSGIVSSDGSQLYRHTAPGLVATVYREEDFEQLVGDIAIGHNRYSTSGGTNIRYNQPFVDYENGFAFAHNGNLPIWDKLEKFLQSRGVSTAKLNDSGMMSAAIGQYMDDGLDLLEAVIKAYPLFEGAFSAVMMDKNRLIAFRDSRGIRPLSIGKLGHGYVIASETCAFDTIGAKFVRDVKPGELVVISKQGLTSHQVVKGQQKLDIFEFVYFARPDSILLAKRVNLVRQNFGRQMAKESLVRADVVVPVPDSSIPAAIGYSQASGIPFDAALIKNRYIHRTFIRPLAEMREQDVNMKLNPVIESLKGKRVVLVDDSIVRGTTMRQVVRMIREAGATEVHLMISSPPVRYPDFYGIDTPKQSDLIATRMSVEEIRDFMGADSLNYLSYQGMIAATELPEKVFSTSCFSGVYPINIGKRAREISKVT
ncbi:amidophosphoribosyltransferase [Candidatus Saccharibacteria bacterium RIFCSPHIGHO2_12_FULL_47_16b]|nr:MAG: amidophosphoribosyltransferase [Candidatus Saccharibacteria bacterium RIFCSPHIGHO2_12_FULL_47_16b]